MRKYQEISGVTVDKWNQQWKRSNYYRWRNRPAQQQDCWFSFEELLKSELSTNIELLDGKKWGWG